MQWLQQTEDARCNESTNKWHSIIKGNLHFTEELLIWISLCLFEMSFFGAEVKGHTPQSKPNKRKLALGFQRSHFDYLLQIEFKRSKVMDIIFFAY